MSFFNNNTRNRNDLDLYRRTMTFKFLFPDYETYKALMVAYKVADADMLSEDNFNMLFDMIGHSWLKWKSDNKNIRYMVYEIKRLNAIKTRETQIYNMTAQEMISSTQTNTFKNFTVNRQENQQISDDYLDFATTQTITSNQPMIDKLKQLQSFLQLQAPEMLFILRLANNIVLPLQPNQRMEVFENANIA